MISPLSGLKKISKLGLIFAAAYILICCALWWTAYNCSCEMYGGIFYALLCIFPWTFLYPHIAEMGIFNEMLLYWFFVLANLGLSYVIGSFIENKWFSKNN